MNILILAAGGVELHDGDYPLCIAEIDGKPLIQWIIDACSEIRDAKFIVALREQDIRSYHLGNMIGLLSPRASVLSVPENTQGAACTAMLATPYIDTDEELLILNGNDLLEANFSSIVSDFHHRDLHAGTVTFSSVHPRYSYVRCDAEGLVVEAAEKNPISRAATAGFYWFKHGKDFVRAVQNMIRKNASVNDLFYICPSLNELILEQRRIGTYAVELSHYHPMKTLQQVSQCETLILQRRSE